MKRFAAAMLALLGVTLHADTTQAPILPQSPTVNRTHITFAYAGDLWTVPRSGGEARRLTSDAGIESDPHYSPDGNQIAFSGEYDGNIDVYLIGASGGIPKRITYHPAKDTVVGWTPDGKQIVFRSLRESYSPAARLFTISSDGAGLPQALPLPMADEGSYSPDGSHIAYVPLPRAFRAWKRYRGGRTSPVWIASLADSAIVKLPRDNSNDFNPMWVGNKIYFLSDRSGPVTLFSYDPGSKKVSELIHNEGFDIKSASAGGDAIVYEQFGAIYLYDCKTGKPHRVEIRVSADFPEIRPHLEKVSKHIANSGLSPSGARVVFEARGEIVTVPAEKGMIRNLTNSPGAADRNPAWSPDGRRIAWFSDESGEYQLHIRDQSGGGEVEKIRLEETPSFYRAPVWSPDSRKIAFLSHLTLWYVDLDKKTTVRVGSDTYDSPSQDLSPSWSPDSRWIAYAPMLKNHMRAIFLYSLEDGKKRQISDGLSDARYPVFDKSGKYLYFAASTDAGLTTGWLDMSSNGYSVTRHVYVAVLSKESPSPLLPENDEEKLAERPREGDAKPPAKDAAKPSKNVRIDLDDLGQRILALPVPPRDYVSLLPGKEGVLFLMEHPLEPGISGNFIRKFDFKTRKTDKVLDPVGSFDVSFDGEKMLYLQSGNWALASTAGVPRPGEGALHLDEMEVLVDPKAEWKQMYHEVWRLERDTFYDPGLHGLDVQAAIARYEPFLEGIVTRSDLNYLFQEMLGEISVGHISVEGGAQPVVRHVRVGLLGADYSIDHGRYRFAKVYAGENWNPQLRAPLTPPGVNVREGEYLLAVSGRELTSAHNLYSFFEDKAGKQVVLRVGPNPDGSGSRDVTVVPIADEQPLRNRTWIEQNRRLVDNLSGGRLAYVYLPNTGDDGWTAFNRYYFSQTGKEGAIIDERFNRGGSMADYVIECLKRPLLNLWHTRDGEDFSTPQNQIFGPKVLLANELSGSGGDALAWMFRDQRIGPVVGKRTWGGLVGIFHIPELIDGGFVSAPNLAFYTPRGEWEVENHGVPPDIEVEYDPAAARAGHDPQLEKAVEVALRELQKRQPSVTARPAYPNYHQGVNAGVEQPPAVASHKF